MAQTSIAAALLMTALSVLAAYHPPTDPSVFGFSMFVLLGVVVGTALAAIMKHEDER